MYIYICLYIYIYTSGPEREPRGADASPLNEGCSFIKSIYLYLYLYICIYIYIYIYIYMCVCVCVHTSGPERDPRGADASPPHEGCNSIKSGSFVRSPPPSPANPPRCISTGAVGPYPSADSTSCQWWLGETEWQCTQPNASTVPNATTWKAVSRSRHGRAESRPEAREPVE